ncbi:MAG: DUF3298 domain-containing protein [Gemmatimonadales bacterium]|nr:MAG: DUF3298 domain-containing protein [Gemmatimonadales bacterium]
MLMLRRAAPVLALLALAACGSQTPDDDPDPDRTTAPGAAHVVRHETVVAEDHSPGCPAVDTATAACTRARLEYPEFEGDHALARALREWTAEWILAPAMFEGDRATSAGAVARDFVEAHAAFRRGDPDAASFGWDLERTVEVTRSVSPVVVLVASEQAYIGGAHSSYRVQHQGFHPDTGEALTLARILGTDAVRHVQALLETRFREDAGLAAEAPLTDGGLFDDLPPGDNLDWEPEGLIFHYNPYEVGPWSTGVIRVRLSWDEVAPHLSADVADLLGPWLTRSSP